MSVATQAIMRLLRTAEARNYSASHREALRAAVVAVERAEADANKPPAPGPSVIYRTSPGSTPPVVRWDEVTGL